jgi:hypothetical protein
VRAHLHAQLSLQYVEGLLVATVDAGSRRAGRDSIVVDGVGACGVPVADLDDHPLADGVREVFAVGRADEDALVFAPHVYASISLARNEVIIGPEGGQRIVQTH